MELSERKKQILKAIVNDYIHTAEPVGSKSIRGKEGLNCSPATIRNEMSELEEMGYLEKPHTSAGRVPSTQGYRLYVDELMSQPTLSPGDVAAINQVMQLKVQELDRLIQQAGRLISGLTHCATVATTPSLTKITIRTFEIVCISETSFVIVLVTENGIVKNKLVNTLAPVTREEAELLTYVLNQTLTGIPIDAITEQRMDIVRRAAGLTALIAPVAEFLAELIEEMSQQNISLTGANQLLAFPEYHDVDKAQRLLDYMSDSRNLAPHLPTVTTKEVDGVRISIGREHGDGPMADTSMIYASYHIGSIGKGIIGVVGPTRMDYADLSARLSLFAKGLNRLVNETFQPEIDASSQEEDTDE